MFPAAMLMETFDRLSRKDKYVWDVSYYVSFFLAIADLGIIDVWPCKPTLPSRLL